MDLLALPVVRLNLGAGRRALDGFLTVDVQGDPDIKADVRSLPIPDACVDEAVSIHVLEHLYRWEAPAALREWHRVLKPGGLLAIEVPDLLKCAASIIAGGKERAGVWGVFGDPNYGDPLMVHRWCYTAAELCGELRKVGFARVRVRDPQFHKPYRDMRVEARKAAT